MPFTDNWKTLKKEPGFWRIKARFEKTIWGRIKSLLYKDDPVFVDIFSGNITRRIKVVPALAEASGIWLSPRFEHPSSGSEPYLIADSLHWITGAGWKPRPKDLSLVWTPLSSESDFLPHWSETGILSTPARELFRQEAGVETVATGGYSSGWTQVLDSIPTQVFEISTGIQSPKNNNCCLLVLSVTDANGKAVFYDNTEYCAQGVGENVFWPVSLRTKIPPDIALPCTAKVYVWNTGSRAILCKQLAVKG